MKEVKVQNAITVTPITGGHQIEIHPERPPLTPLILAGGGGLVMFLIGSIEHSLRVLNFMSYLLFALCAWHIFRHSKKQIVSIANNKLMVDEKAYDIGSISRIEFGNAITKTTSASHTPSTTTFIAASTNMSTAVGVGMANAMSGVANAGIASNAKKAFYVAIFFGNKKITIAKNMREPAGLAFYDELGRQLSMA